MEQAPKVMPVLVGVHLASAALQVIADDAGVDVLHLKGPAVDASLRPSTVQTDPDTGAQVRVAVPRRSTDVDLLVRPAHVGRLFAALRAHGWIMAYRFEDGSAFEHASTWRRDGLAWADIHRHFPGTGPDAAAVFDRLWQDRREAVIAGYRCVVPDLAAQRLILVLHATRGGDLAGEDMRQAWAKASVAERAELEALAAEVGAVVALAAGTGRIEEHRRAPDYLLWKLLSRKDPSRSAMWVARVRAQPGVWRKLRTALWLVMPKPGRIERDLGRKPTAGEMARAWGRQVQVAAAEVGRAVSGWVGRVRR